MRVGLRFRPAHFSSSTATSASVNHRGTAKRRPTTRPPRRTTIRTTHPTRGRGRRQSGRPAADARSSQCTGFRSLCG